jgi:sugar lactone lactonase YvrE
VSSHRPLAGKLAVTSNAVASSSEQTLLGEGARWDARRDELLGVDILAGRVFRARAGGDGGLRLVRDYRLPGTVGAIAPVEGDDGWLLAAGRGFFYLSPDGSLRWPAKLARTEEGTQWLCTLKTTL